MDIWDYQCHIIHNWNFPVIYYHIKDPITAYNSTTEPPEWLTEKVYNDNINMIMCIFGSLFVKFGFKTA